MSINIQRMNQSFFHLHCIVYIDIACISIACVLHMVYNSTYSLRITFDIIPIRIRLIIIIHWIFVSSDFLDILIIIVIFSYYVLPNFRYTSTSQISLGVVFCKKKPDIQQHIRC